MFIINIDHINKNVLYECNKDYSKYLQLKGFPLLGIRNDKYYFRKTKSLLKFLELEGGDENI